MGNIGRKGNEDFLFFQWNNTMNGNQIFMNEKIKYKNNINNNKNELLSNFY